MKSHRIRVITISCPIIRPQFRDIVKQNGITFTSLRCFDGDTNPTKHITKMYEIKPDQILASAYTMIVLTGIAIVSRFFLRGLRNEAFRLEDGFMLFAFVTFNILSTITIVVVPIAYQIVAVSYDLKPLYNGLFDDEEYQLRVVFASNLLFPMVLWSVKVSLLLLSRRLMYQYREWIRAWWVVLGFVALVLPSQI